MCDCGHSCCSISELAASVWESISRNDRIVVEMSAHTALYIGRIKTSSTLMLEPQIWQGKCFWKLRRTDERAVP